MAEAGPIPFQEAIDYFAGKVNLPTKRYDDLTRGAHVRAFTVAGMVRDDMLSEIRTAIADAQTSGTGLKAFQKTFDALVDRTGWKFNARGGTDTERRAWRARIIYTTNMRTAYMAGRYKQMTDPDVLKYRPYWQYKHSGALHPRLLHLSWNGLVLAATDPAWKIMFPPNGWGCGCDVIALNRRQLAALGKTGPDEAPDLQPYEQKDPRTGENLTRYAGIDRGWDYNPGEEWLNGVVPRELSKPLPPVDVEPRRPENLPPMPPAVKAPTRRLLPDDLPAENYISAFMGEFGVTANAAAIHRDKSGGIIAISRSLFEARDVDGAVLGLKAAKWGRGPYALLMADALRDPDEIWVDWVKVTSGIVLRRAYLKRFILPDGRGLMLRFEWGKYGWTGITVFDPKPGYIDRQRTGALLYAKKD